MFKKYQHVERFGNEEVMGIELGECYVFPKLDGTNASLWLEGQTIEGGSRNRQLSLENDNAGFLNKVRNWPDWTISDFFTKYPNLRLYGEWLVPHTIKTYKEDAWRKFYIFDVLNDDIDQLLHYEVYKPLLEEFNLDFIPPLAKIKNGSYENFIHVLEQNNFYIKDGEGIGEGVVIKNYAFYNKFGRQTWAKIVSSEFKEQHYKTMGCPETLGKMIEEEIINKYQTATLVQKTYQKIHNECEGWQSQYIPRLLDTVYYDLIKEELWEALKEHKFPTINFRTLKSFSTANIKTTLPELF